MYEKQTLPNGVRIVYEHMPHVRSAAIGVWVGVGSRYESPCEAGSAHFIEHMLFKGTAQHSASELAERMDAIGGQVNAYTTREGTCYYARVLDEHLDRAGDLLAEMLFTSNFSETDADNERGVIREEMDMYADTPEDLVTERLIGAAFPGALGRPVLGRPATIDRLTGARLRSFQIAHYIAPRIVIAVSGSFTDENIARLAAHFSWLPVRPDLTMRSGSYTPAFTLKRKAIEQNQISIGFPGLPTGAEERFTMALLSSILGGNMSSRLFQTVREKNGLCYAIYTYTASFLDCGMFGISAAVGRETEQRALALIRDELERFRTDGVTQSELDRAREQVHASVLMAEESTASRMNKLGYSELYLGRVLPADEVLARYDAVTREDILGLARETLDFDCVSFSAVGRLRPQEEYAQQLRTETEKRRGGLRGVFLFQSSDSPAMTVCRMRRIPHPRRLRKGADSAAMYRKTEPRRLQEEAAGGVLLFQAFWISSSAICTQLVAAPLRTWSPQHQRHRPLGSVRSGRMRPTNTRS